ncbi:guanine deaminase [Sulfidibacter corallicola]|uniref:Guanine deaminase n=1 Tax=Sulfidibacter corallicola TaxID=2818388 RepID=A0A8A4TEV3_SULCO|nr:guanine deaminase [Sulfidibacter corallicola]QTD47752.1 guanine deaminase [Sulfidibacter corallicola]
MKRLFLGIVAHVLENPFTGSAEDCLEIIEDGALLADEHGKILARGPKQTLMAAHPDAEIVDFGDDWLLPGFVDGHVHFPQVYATAAYGHHLLDWLQTSVFPAELAFADEAFAVVAARRFVHQLLRMGTTTALVFGSQFTPATRALFEAARQQGLRLISGLTLMDLDAPARLLHTPQSAYDECRQLIRMTEKTPGLYYAVTPRFALSCSPAMMDVCRSLIEEFPDCYLQTHINENLDEIEAVKASFPEAHNYLDVYARQGLLSPRTVLAHSVHSTDAELDRMAELDCRVCHCPASNMYLGSGIFNLARHLERRIQVLVGTDIGAGTNFSILEELSDVYKAQQMYDMRLGAAKLLYLGTLAGAEALHLAGETGNFAEGKSADFVVLSSQTDLCFQERLARCTSRKDQLFAWLNMFRPSHLRATYSGGRLVIPEERP